MLVLSSHREWGTYRILSLQLHWRRSRQLERRYYAVLQADFLVPEFASDHPVLTPALYTPDAKIGARWSTKGMPTSEVPRLYHSSITLTPQGNFLIAGAWL